MGTPGGLALKSSFRDPAGHVFVEDGIVKRAVTETGISEYYSFLLSGLYNDLAADGLIVKHIEEKKRPAAPGSAITIVPEQIGFVSYPYEWSFSQLKDAALLTLEIQRRALLRGMSLKGASAFSIQFRGCTPVLIDTLSFERNDGGPWPAYNQFCRHFLAPLALSAYVSAPLNRFLAVSLDGFPLELASRLLPFRTRFRPGLLTHLHAHARAAGAGRAGEVSTAPAGPDRKAPLTESLRATVGALHLPKRRTEWNECDHDPAHYPAEAGETRRRWVADRIRAHRPALTFDLGADTGEYSRLAASQGGFCVSMETDAVCANESYLRAKREGHSRILPLLMDLREPSPSLGFDLSERMSLFERPRADLVLALALVHHLRITGQIPLSRLASFLCRLGNRVLIEFVPKEDPMVRETPAHRQDVFGDYGFREFVGTFGRAFELVETQAVPGTSRVLCEFAKRNEAAA